MKLSTIINKNKSLKTKINTELKAKGNPSTIKSNNNVGVKQNSNVTIDGDLKNKILQKLSENNFISTTTSGKVKSSGVHNISASGMNALIHQNDIKDNDKIDDSNLIGGYRVVESIDDRNAIDCCFRKLGMMVMVIGDDFSFTEYVLTENLCDNNGWVEFTPSTTVDTIFEEDIELTEDYSILDPTVQIQTQKDLNKVLKEILLDILNTPLTGDKTYEHDQISPDNFWYINHNLGKYPNIQVFDSTKREVKTKIRHIDINNSISESNVPFNGKATCN